MNVSKTLTAVIAASAIVGTVGYVSAQTQSNDPATTPSQSTEPMQSQSAQPAATTPDASTTPSSSDSNSAPSTSEPQPKADRN